MEESYAEDEAEAEEEEGLREGAELVNRQLTRCGWPIEVRRAPGRGRYAVAARAVAPGEVLLREAAFAGAVMPPKGFSCHACLRFEAGPAPPLRLACSRCAQVAFCSPDCFASSGKPVEALSSSLLSSFSCAQLLFDQHEWCTPGQSAKH